MTECALPGFHRPAMSPGHMEYCSQDHANKSWHMPLRDDYAPPVHGVKHVPWDFWDSKFWWGFGIGVLVTTAGFSVLLYGIAVS